MYVQGDNNKQGIEVVKKDASDTTRTLLFIAEGSKRDRAGTVRLA